MMWFELIGNSLAFIGSVLFSADLLKTKEQIQDENKTYLNTNPYTTKNGLKSVPLYVVAFFLIVTGFAITLGGSIGEIAALNIIDSSLICSLAAISGYLLMSLIYLVNKRHHKISKANLKVRIFYSTLESMVKRYEKIIDQQNENELFVKYKSNSIESLEERLADMLIPPEQHMKDIVALLGKKRTVNTFIYCLKNYVREHVNNLDEPITK